MVKVKKKIQRINKIEGEIASNERQSLPERIRYLRSLQKPFMTQKQLAYMARVHANTVLSIENTKSTADLNFSINTIRKIANALGCKIFINIKMIPSRSKAECLPLESKLPPPLKLKRKSTGRGRQQAAKYGSYHGRRAVQQQYRELRKSTSDKPDLALEEPKAE